MNNPVVSIPSANILLSSLRSVGYTPETAIADIVDNSLSAKASVVDINFDCEKQRITIADNGDGMTKSELLSSMSIGSSDPLNERSIHDLGRFGMGMKTASFSLGKKLTVISKTKDEISNACWDLDYVRQSDKWEILINDSSDAFINELSDSISQYRCGTIVCISNVDKLIAFDSSAEKKKFYKMIDNVKSHLSLVFTGLWNPMRFR
ncbi:MAG: ATP-binding protein [Clostridiales bacterium]|nr:ATP-binding protein [Clostridiales bacterium]